MSKPRQTRFALRPFPEPWTRRRSDLSPCSPTELRHLLERGLTLPSWEYRRWNLAGRWEEHLIWSSSPWEEVEEEVDSLCRWWSSSPALFRIHREPTSTSISTNYARSYPRRPLLTPTTFAFSHEDHDRGRGPLRRVRIRL